MYMIFFLFLHYIILLSLSARAHNNVIYNIYVLLFTHVYIYYMWTMIFFLIPFFLRVPHRWHGGGLLRGGVGIVVGFI